MAEDLNKEENNKNKEEKEVKAKKEESTNRGGKIKETESKEEKSEKTATPSKSKKKARRRIVPEGRAYIQAGFNNTLISITDENGEVLCQSSAGASGFKGPKKATPYAAQTAAEKVSEKAKIYGVERVHVFIKGAGNGREQAMRGLLSGGILIESITDLTAIPHNGCRRKKSRRV